LNKIQVYVRIYVYTVNTQRNVTRYEKVCVVVLYIKLLVQNCFKISVHDARNWFKKCVANTIVAFCLKPAN